MIALCQSSGLRGPLARHYHAELRRAVAAAAMPSVEQDRHTTHFTRDFQPSRERSEMLARWSTHCETFTPYRRNVVLRRRRLDVSAGARVGLDPQLVSSRGKILPDHRRLCWRPKVKGWVDQRMLEALCLLTDDRPACFPPSRVLLARPFATCCFRMACVAKRGVVFPLQPNTCCVVYVAWFNCCVATCCFRMACVARSGCCIWELVYSQCCIYLTGCVFMCCVGIWKYGYLVLTTHCRP